MRLIVTGPLRRPSRVILFLIEGRRALCKRKQQPGNLSLGPGAMILDMFLGSFISASISFITVIRVRVMTWPHVSSLILATTRKLHWQQLLSVLSGNTSPGACHIVEIADREEGMEGSLLVLHQAEGSGLGFPRHLKPTGPSSWFLTWGFGDFWDC